MWIQHEEVLQMVYCFVDFLDEEDREEVGRYAMLILLTYCFLLRLPSEALPVVRGDNGIINLCSTCMTICCICV